MNVESLDYEYKNGVLVQLDKKDIQELRYALAELSYPNGGVYTKRCLIPFVRYLLAETGD